MKKVLLAWSIMASLGAVTLSDAFADEPIEAIPIPVPRCWVVNCRTFCNGTPCIACVQAACGNGNGDPTDWCNAKFQTDPCDNGASE